MRIFLDIPPTSLYLGISLAPIVLASKHWSVCYVVKNKEYAFQIGKRTSYWSQQEPCEENLVPGYNEEIFKNNITKTM